MLLKGQFRNPPKAVVLGQGKELSVFQMESQDDGVWGAEVELPRESTWTFQLNLDGEVIETYVLPPAYQSVSLALEVEKLSFQHLKM